MKFNCGYTRDPVYEAYYGYTMTYAKAILPH